MAFFGANISKRVSAVIKQRHQASKKPTTSGFKTLYDKKKAESEKPATSGFKQLYDEKKAESEKPTTSGFKQLYDKKKAESKRPTKRKRLVSAIKNRQKKHSSVRDWFKSRGRR